MHLGFPESVIEVYICCPNKIMSGTFFKIHTVGGDPNYVLIHNFNILKYLIL